LLKEWNDDQRAQWFIQSVKNAPAMTQDLLQKEASNRLQRANELDTSGG
jgi:hypothetical protein